jgi:hypothetical protein
MRTIYLLSVPAPPFAQPKGRPQPKYKDREAKHWLND